MVAQVAAPARKKKAAVPPPLFGMEDPQTGNVLRDIFYWDPTTADEGVISHAFSEPPGTAVENWAVLFAFGGNGGLVAR